MRCAPLLPADGEAAQLGLLMRHPVVLPLLLLALSGAGCEKIKSWISPAEPAPGAPRRNTAESLGVATGDLNSYAQEAPAPAAEAPAPAATPTELRRVLTHRDGRTLEAVLLGRTDTEVKLRRVSDGREFTMVLADLSDADRAFIQENNLAYLDGR